MRRNHLLQCLIVVFVSMSSSSLVARPTRRLSDSGPGQKASGPHKASRKAQAGRVASRTKKRASVNRAGAVASEPRAVEDSPQPILPPGDGTSPWFITYTSDASVIQAWLEEHNDGLLGFDTETRPTYRRGETRAPATLQLAGAGAGLVVHLAHLDPNEAGWPAGLVDVLANASVLKVGVGIDNDAIDLWQHFGYEVRGRFDLSGVQAQPGPARGMVGLRSLAASYLGVELFKSNAIAKSNWELRPLSLRQLSYAALDSWVGREVFLVLARLSPRTFAPAVARELVAEERTIGDLYARRLMRRAVKEAALRVETQLQGDIDFERSIELIVPIGYGQVPHVARLRNVQRRVSTLRQQCARVLADNATIQVKVLVDTSCGGLHGVDQ